MSSSQLTNIFQRGGPTTNQLWYTNVRNTLGNSPRIMFFPGEVFNMTGINQLEMGDQTNTLFQQYSLNHKPLGGLVAIWIIVPFSWVANHPNWLIFFRGVAQPPTSKEVDTSRCVSWITLVAEMVHFCDVCDRRKCLNIKTHYATWAIVSVRTLSCLKIGCSSNSHGDKSWFSPSEKEKRYDSWLSGYPLIFKHTQYTYLLVIYYLVVHPT